MSPKIKKTPQMIIYYLSGAAGLIVSINRIMTKLLLHDARENTIIFFCVSIATVVMCAVVFHITRRTQFVR